jgi:hypothetical protein
MPSWDDHYGESDSPAARYQAALDREFRVRMVEGTPVPGGWRRPVEPVCERCWYVVVDGACVGCGPWAHPSLSERDESRIVAESLVGGGGRAQKPLPGHSRTPRLSPSRSERDAA